MHITSVPLLLLAAGTVGLLHSILPDHWVPLAVVARTRRWSLFQTAKISLLASAGHIVTSIVLAGIIAVIGLQFRTVFEAQQSHIVGVILVATGLGFLAWSLTGHGHHEHHPEHERAAIPGAGGLLFGEHGHNHPVSRSLAGRATAIVIPFGAAASPDLTVLPVALAASGVGVAAVGGVLLTFSATTLITFVGLTVAATMAGYQVKGEWLEEHGMQITGGVLVVIGGAVFLGL